MRLTYHYGLYLELLVLIDRSGDLELEDDGKFFDYDYCSVTSE